MTPAPTLPDKPVDGFTITYWTTDSRFGITERQLVYYVNRTWQQLFPKDTGRPGVPFVNHWGVYEEGRLKGRTMDGWAEPVRHMLNPEHQRVFFRVEEAEADFVRVARERLERLAEEARELRLMIRRKGHRRAR